VSGRKQGGREGGRERELTRLMRRGGGDENSSGAVADDGEVVAMLLACRRAVCVCVCVGGRVSGKSKHLVWKKKPQQPPLPPSVPGLVAAL